MIVPVYILYHVTVFTIITINIVYLKTAHFDNYSVYKQVLNVTSKSRRPLV